MSSKIKDAEISEILRSIREIILSDTPEKPLTPIEIVLDEFQNNRQRMAQEIIALRKRLELLEK